MIVGEIQSPDVMAPPECMRFVSARVVKSLPAPLREGMGLQSYCPWVAHMSQALEATPIIKGCNWPTVIEQGILGKCQERSLPHQYWSLRMWWLFSLLQAHTPKVSPWVLEYSQRSDTCSTPGTVAFTLDTPLSLLELYLVAERLKILRKSVDKESESWKSELSQSNNFTQLHSYPSLHKLCRAQAAWPFLVALEFPNWKCPNPKIHRWGISLVVQWLKIHLPMQGTQVRALVQEDPTCRGATKPVRHNYWACALEPASHNYWSPRATTTEAHVPRARAPQQEKLPQWEACAPQQRVVPACCN